MAIIHCPDCDREISDAAPTCPGCGRPMSAPLAPVKRRVGILLGLGIFFLPVIFAWFTLRKGHSTASRIVSFAYLGATIAFFASIGDQHPPVLANIPRAAVVASAFATTANELAAAYDANTVAADLRFKGKRFTVTGIVSNINTNFFGDPYLTLSGDVNRFLEPQFQFGKDSAATLSRLGKGSRVTLVCTGAGDVAKTPMSRDCVLSQGN